LIVSVRNLNKRHDVLAQGWDRMSHSVNQERATALIEIGKIVNHRFDDLVAEANPIHTARTQRFDQLGQ
jgi:2-oxo-4-hydroxy-4-carboxy--5-ureidoimidazoline (OHCU) decarboxylase